MCVISETRLLELETQLFGQVAECLSTWASSSLEWDYHANCLTDDWEDYMGQFSQSAQLRGWPTQKC